MIYATTTGVALLDFEYDRAIGAAENCLRAAGVSARDAYAAYCARSDGAPLDDSLQKRAAAAWADAEHAAWLAAALRWEDPEGLELSLGWLDTADDEDATP